MRRNICIILLLFLTVFLCGCQRKRIQCRYVTQVDIHCDHEGTPIVRSYTTEDKMGAVLMYLRLLQFSGAPSLDPDTVPADVYQISVTLSDGSRRVYSQKDHRYFRKPTSGWQNISPVQAAELYALMRHFESDI